MKKLYAVVYLTLVLSLFTACGGASRNTTALKVTGSVDTMTGWTDKELRVMRSINVQEVKKDGTKENRNGVLLMTLLDIAGVKQGATLVTLVSYDYAVDVPLAELTECDNCIVAFQDDGKGFDMILPGFAGKVQVREVTEIRVQ